MKPNRLVFATVLTDDFVPGFCALIHSIRKHNPTFDFEFRVIHHDRLAPLSIAWRQLLKKAFPFVSFWEVNDPGLLEMIDENAAIAEERSRLLGAYAKLFCFSFGDVDQVVFLDSDILCLRPIDELLKPCDTFSACAGWDPRKSKPFNFFNTGVMVIGSEYLEGEFYRSLVGFRLAKNFDRRVGPADQAVINYLIRFADAQLLTHVYNFTKRFLADVDFEQSLQTSEPILVHYVAEKPWQMGIGGRGFCSVDGLWWEYYDEFFATFPYQDEFRLRLSAKMAPISGEKHAKGKLDRQEKSEVSLLGKRMPFKKEKWREKLRFWNFKKSGAFCYGGPALKPAMSPKGKFAIATVVDLAYLEGTEVLLSSLKERNPDLEFDFVVFSRGDIPTIQLESLKELHPDVVSRRINEVRYEAITPHPRLGRTSFYVFDVFSLREYDRVIYLDSDILCLRGIAGLVDCESDFAAVPNVGHSLYTEKLWGTERAVFNSGVMSIGKKYLGKGITKELIALAADNAGKEDPAISRFADQRVINHFFRKKEIEFLPLNFNGLSKLAKLISEKDMKQVALLHYTGVNPWKYLHRKSDYPGVSLSEDRYMRVWGRAQKKTREKIRSWQFAHGGALEKWELLRAKRKSGRCFILGNGPSLQQQDLTLIKDEFSMVSNWFGLHPQYEAINPSLYTIGSHTVFGGWRADKPCIDESFHRMLLGAARHTPKVFSFNFKEYIESENLFSMQDLYYLIYEKPLKQHILSAGALQFDPLKPVVEADTVVLTFSVMIAVYLGFKEIYLLGCDCDYGSSATKGASSRYFYDISKHSTKTSSDEHIAKVWSDEGRIFEAYELVRKSCEANGVRLLNATAGGKLEVLPRVDYESLFEE